MIAGNLRCLTRGHVNRTARFDMFEAGCNEGQNRMGRTNFMDAAFLAAGLTFLMFLLAQAMNLLVHGN